MFPFNPPEDIFRGIKREHLKEKGEHRKIFKVGLTIFQHYQ